MKNKDSQGIRNTKIDNKSSPQIKHTRIIGIMTITKRMETDNGILVTKEFNLNVMKEEMVILEILLEEMSDQLNNHIKLKVQNLSMIQKERIQIYLGRVDVNLIIAKDLIILMNKQIISKMLEFQVIHQILQLKMIN